MKTTEKNRLLHVMMNEKRLGAPHFRTLIFMMGQKKTVVCGKDLQQAFGMTSQQVNKVIHDLIDWKYVRLYGKMESGRVLYYQIDPDRYAVDAELKTKQLDIDDMGV